MTEKATSGNFFEDFRLGAVIRHPIPRQIAGGETALYIALTGSRFALNCGDLFAQSLGLPAAPLDDLLLFHLVFARSVGDISRNAIANLGYAEGRFGDFVYPGDTLVAESTILGLKENAAGDSGIVYVRTLGRNQKGATILDFRRWVMVRKRNAESPASAPEVPRFAAALGANDLALPAGLDLTRYDREASGSPYLWEDYAIGEKIDHGEGMTLEEADHMMATRLYQNNARVHFDAYAQRAGRWGRRLVYGGHVLSLARALSWNGLANLFRIAAINGGRHVAPVFAGDTLYAWSEVLDKAPLAGRRDLGALRLRLVAAKDRPCADFPGPDATGKYPGSVVLDFDYWGLMPRRVD